MTGTASDLRVGAVINYNGDLCAVIKYEHVTPGKGRAHHQVKLRNILTGRLQEARFATGEKIEFVRVEKRPYQYLYKDGNAYYFMNAETFEQVPVDESLVGEQSKFMKETQEVFLSFVDDKVIGVELPPAVELQVSYTEPGVRGDTATNVLKPATLETGAVVQVPLFINEGDRIKINVETGEYLESAK